MSYFEEVARAHQTQSGIVNQEALASYLQQKGFARVAAKRYAATVLPLPSLSEERHEEYSDGANGYD
jgi:hypothetical protein